MDTHLHADTQPPRALKRSELEAHRCQRRALASELDHGIQTRQDTAALSQRLADLDATIARLEHEVGPL